MLQKVAKYVTNPIQALIRITKDKSPKMGALSERGAGVRNSQGQPSKPFVNIFYFCVKQSPAE